MASSALEAFDDFMTTNQGIIAQRLAKAEEQEKSKVRADSHTTASNLRINATKAEVNEKAENGQNKEASGSGGAGIVKGISWAIVPPADLLVLASVARNFSNILASDSIWTKSRELIGIPAPPNILQSEINLWTPAWTEKKFAAFIFGLARCSSCCNASKGLPKHYLLPFQVRLCSDVCLDRFLREKAAEVDVRGYAGALVTHRSSYRNWLPATRIQGTERRLHLISQIRAAEAEFVECRDDPARLVMLNSELDERRKATVKIGQVINSVWSTLLILTVSALGQYSTMALEEQI
ncbi:hypothetical protein C8J56DRAFT_1170790 [Mycena floridula]|nr:hypothetical protein C8J56DRAFT_1170790 [Mycena floridula]